MEERLPDVGKPKSRYIASASASKAASQRVAPQGLGRFACTAVRSLPAPQFERATGCEERWRRALGSSRVCEGGY